MDVKNILYGLLLTLATIMFMWGGIALFLWLTDGLPLVFKRNRQEIPEVFSLGG